MSLIENAREKLTPPGQGSTTTPSHYKGNGVEAIQVIEAFDLNFHLGNVVKYVLRADRKGNSPVEDLRKAQWYLEREISRRTPRVPQGTAEVAIETYATALPSPCHKNASIALVTNSKTGRFVLLCSECYAEMGRWGRESRIRGALVRESTALFLQRDS